MNRFCKNTIKYLFAANNNYRECSRLSSASSASSQPLMNRSLKIGDNLHGFHVNRVEDISELCLSCYHLHHAKSGAEHVHIARDDSDNVFAVCLRTTPRDSTGVAHILEHLSLCGSNRYPCRDPFMKMIHRSLATFMNAFTSPDNTMYPFSTQNLKDYYNLLSVYLDAVFYPRLRNVDFRQEGWRLEHQNVDDSTSPVIIKGVVFNEMKGAFSSPAAIYERNLLNSIFPANTYAHESGGHPLSIPSLTHQQLIQFHSLHYHPSNARFYTYGNFPLETHLSFINEYILNRFDYREDIKNLSYIPEQIRWKSPVRKSISCQFDPMATFIDKQTTVSVTYMLENITNIHENFTLAILCALLMDGPNSPFHQSLIDSGLGSDYSPHSGFTNYTKQSLFSIGLQEISKSDVDLVVKTIELTFEKALKEGFSNERIEAFLHRIELSTKHQAKNFGLRLIMNFNSMWNQNGDPIQNLKVNEQVEHFRNQIKNNPNFLKDKIKEYFILNKHKLILEMSPSNDFESNEKQKEDEILKEKLSKLNNEQIKKIYNEGIELKEVQQLQEDLSVLPTLSVNTDVSKEFKALNIEKTNILGVDTQFSVQPTNGITYFNAILKLNLNEFPQHLIPYLALFSQVITKLGAGKMNRNELDQQINLTTGGLNVSVHVADNPSQFDLFECGLLLSSHCLERNIGHMFQIWTDIFNKIRFDDDYDYLQQLVKMCASELAMSVPTYGHKYAMSRASAPISGAHQMREITSGLTSLSDMRKTAAIKECHIIAENLKQIAAILLRSSSLRCAINTESQSLTPSMKILEGFIQSIENKKTFAVNDNEPNVMKRWSEFALREHHIFPFSVNYLGNARLCVPFTHNDYAKLQIAAKLVSAKYLHREIREKGGAYGGGALLSDGGVYLNYSYRDPNLIQTIDAFSESTKWLEDQNNYSDQDIDEAKLSTFQYVDQPILPNEHGLDYFITGKSADIKHEYRMRLLDVTKRDIPEVALKYLANDTDNLRLVLIGPHSDLTKDNSKWIIKDEKPE